MHGDEFSTQCILCFLRDIHLLLPMLLIAVKVQFSIFFIGFRHACSITYKVFIMELTPLSQEFLSSLPVQRSSTINSLSYSSVSIRCQARTAEFSYRVCQNFQELFCNVSFQLSLVIKPVSFLLLLY